jgi:NitT/TauT family transport system permease protein
LLALLILWEAAAIFVDSDMLPGPGAVALVLIRETVSGDLLAHLGATLARVAASFVVAMTVGMAIGLIMGAVPLIDRMFDSWLIILLNLPALVVIILAYVWIGLVESALVLAVSLNKIPNVAVTMREGARALDPDLADMARSFRLSAWARFRHVVAPQLFPFIAASARTGLALIWKIVLVAELLGRSNGIGFQLNLSFQLFDVAAILAYSLAFILVIQAIEHLILQPVERRAHQWRK